MSLAAKGAERPSRERAARRTTPGCHAAPFVVEVNREDDLVRAVVKGIGQPPDNGPLVWVRVLRFIHQHVAQALIQLERHPCPSAVFGGQQIDGF